jgi:hypothetical protein
MGTTALLSEILQPQMTLVHSPNMPWPAHWTRNRLAPCFPRLALLFAPRATHRAPPHPPLALRPTIFLVPVQYGSMCLHACRAVPSLQIKEKLVKDLQVCGLVYSYVLLSCSSVCLRVSKTESYGISRICFAMTRQATMPSSSAEVSLRIQNRELRSQ